MPTISGLFIYPIKSCGGISLETAEVAERGFRYDRRWMVVDSSNRFMTQREHPRLALIRVSVSNGHLNLTAPGMPPFSLPLELSDGSPVEVVVWKDAVHSMTANEDAHSWFSDFLQVDCGPVYMPETAQRHVRSRHPVSFVDAYPFLLLSQESLEDLNKRLASPLPMNRFRPNIVVAGCRPYEEDTWKSFRAGPVGFRAAKPCSRCATTTVDQETGMTGKEPLATLARYRNTGNGVIFGMNLIHEGIGTLRVGDALSF